MCTLLSSRLRFAFLLFVVGLAAAPAAQADATDVCFNFIDAQDYARAEVEAKALLQRSDLGRAEQRLAQLCLGRAYNNMGRIRDALTAFRQVEALSQTTAELALAYNWLGTIYADINDLDRADLYEQRALKGFRESGDKSNEASTLHTLALVANRRGDVERALALYQESLALQPDEARKLATLSNIAVIYAGRKQYDQAAQMLRQAVEIGRRNGNAHGAAICQLNLGALLRHQGKLKDAGKELTAGLNAIRLVGDKHWEAVACEFLADLALARKQTPLAHEWYAKAEASFREIGDTANADRIADLLAGK